jgi:hypothetical protein
MPFGVFRRTIKGLPALALVGCLLLLLSGMGQYFQHQNDLRSFIRSPIAQGAIYLAAVWLVLKESRVPRALILILLDNKAVAGRVE